MNDLKRGCTNNQVTYQQLGAPALVYYQNSEYDVDASVAQGKPSSIENTHQRLCRAKFQFHLPSNNVAKSSPNDDQRDGDSRDPEPQEKPLETAAAQTNSKKTTNQPKA